MSLLAYPVRCPLADRGAVLSGAVLSGAAGGEKLKKSARSTTEKIFFARFFCFFQKTFPCSKLLFSPVLRTSTRACVFIIFEKNS